MVVFYGQNREVVATLGNGEITYFVYPFSALATHFLGRFL